VQKEGDNMPINATVTAQTGPARQVTAMPIVASGLLLLPDRKVMQLFQGGDTNSPPMKDFDLTSVTTITVTIVGSNYNVVLS
jgi:hypothetical protein